MNIPNLSGSKTLSFGNKAKGNRGVTSSRLFQQDEQVTHLIEEIKKLKDALNETRTSLQEEKIQHKKTKIKLRKYEKFIKDRSLNFQVPEEDVTSIDSAGSGELTSDSDSIEKNKEKKEKRFK